MITTSQLQVTIEHIVRTHYAIKNADLVLKTIEHLHPSLFSREEYEIVLLSMIQSGDILELEYVSPEIDYRIKSIYFVKGTRFINLTDLIK